MGLQWGVRPSHTRKLVPFWCPFWTHARYAIFPNKKCPKWPFFSFYPVCPPFRPSRAIKMTFFLAFFLWYFGEFHRVLPKSFHYFPIFGDFFEVFGHFFTISIFAFLLGYFRFREVKLARTISVAIRGVVGWNFAGGRGGRGEAGWASNKFGLLWSRFSPLPRLCKSHIHASGLGWVEQQQQQQQTTTRTATTTDNNNHRQQTTTTDNNNNRQQQEQQQQQTTTTDSNNNRQQQQQQTTTDNYSRQQQQTTTTATTKANNNRQQQTTTADNNNNRQQQEPSPV